ncbi:hypothetical protein NQ315_005844 [Exocentrus adspersus]|uniref:Tyr recombinase domain-containing protein n=1 Tax=Exocentrus adspersus TaxID=1586481 RepID=A0AAV8VS27_9CUCU|nr:hypothetical protein NQ315_005844 [Exocentrus adspersus]
MENFELEDAVKEVMDGILPKKSRKIYEAQYDTFVKWCCHENWKMSTKMFYLCFFAEKSKTLSSSTLWAHYSMLKTMLNVKRNIDVSKFYKLSAFLKRKSEGYKPKNAKVLTLDQIDKFLLEVPVALIFGVAGACRGKELHQLTISDVTDMDHALLVNVRNTKNNVDHLGSLADSGAHSVWKRHGGWKSASVAEGYIENSINTKKIVADLWTWGWNSTESASRIKFWICRLSRRHRLLQNTIDGANRLLNIVNCSNVKTATSFIRELDGASVENFKNTNKLIRAYFTMEPYLKKTREQFRKPH